MSAKSLVTGPNPVRRRRWRASASLSVAPGFTGMGSPPRPDVVRLLVGAGHPAALRRAGFDPELHDVDEVVVERGPAERHAGTLRAVEVARELVEDVAVL